MKKVLLLTLLIGLFAACKKDGSKDIYVHVDEIFNTRVIDNVIFVDSGIQYPINVELIKDQRMFGVDCMSSTGGDIQLRVKVKNEVMQTDTIYFRGCGNGFDCPSYLTCSYAAFRNYKIYLINISPLDKKNQNIKDYSVKLIIKRN